MSMIQQNVFMFDDSIKENIKLFSLLQLPEFQENQNQYLLQNCQN